MKDPEELSQDPERAALVLLVVRCQLGERGAPDQLVVDWQPDVHRYVRSFVQGKRETHEICQDVWLGVLRGLPRLQKRESFAPWLFGIARRSALNCLRRRYRRAPEDVWDDGDGLPADLHSIPAPEVRPSAMELEAGLDRLDPLEREVLVLYYLQELYVEEVCDAI